MMLVHHLLYPLLHLLYPLLLSSLPRGVGGQAYTSVTTFAGSGAAAFADGVGAGASFNDPTGVTIDAAKNLFICDQLNHRVRRITPGGLVATLAGSGAAGFANGAGAGAKFNSPFGVAFLNGSLVVTDSANNRIRYITLGGAVTTLAGDGSARFADGVGTNAAFSGPRGVAVGSNGIIYVADSQRIRTVLEPGGLVSTLAGSGAAGSANGAGAAAQFNGPFGLAFDASSGTLVLADNSNHRIRRITLGGMVTTLAGSGTKSYRDGVGGGASFYYPEAWPWTKTESFTWRAVGTTAFAR